MWNTTYHKTQTLCTQLSKEREQVTRSGCWRVSGAATAMSLLKVWWFYKRAPTSDNKQVVSIQDDCKSEILKSEPSNSEGNLYKDITPPFSYLDANSQHSFYFFTNLFTFLTNKCYLLFYPNPFLSFSYLSFSLIQTHFSLLSLSKYTQFSITFLLLLSLLIQTHSFTFLNSEPSAPLNHKMIIFNSLIFFPLVLFLHSPLPTVSPTFVWAQQRCMVRVAAPSCGGTERSGEHRGTHHAPGTPAVPLTPWR